MKPVRAFAAAGIAGALALGAAAPVFAQVPPGCAALCAVTCVKPISIPDRWDDATPIPGYTGGAKRPNWQNNGMYDREAFTDLNGNGLWDPGETFVDANGNGAYDAEAYDPIHTGFIADPDPSNPLAPAGDLGLGITLHPGAPGDAPTPGQYLAIDLPPLNRGVPVTGSDEYRSNLAGCSSALVGEGDRCQMEPGLMTSPTNQILHDLLAQDPGAYWDPVTLQVAGSAFPAGASPRILRIPVHDPRIAVASGSAAVVVTKIAAFFMEQITGFAEVQGRFLRASGDGIVCAGGVPNAGFVITCATPARTTTWGHMKGLYR